MAKSTASYIYLTHVLVLQSRPADHYNVIDVWLINICLDKLAATLGGKFTAVFMVVLCMQLADISPSATCGAIFDSVICHTHYREQHSLSSVNRISTSMACNLTNGFC